MISENHMVRTWRKELGLAREKHSTTTSDLVEREGKREGERGTKRERESGRERQRENTRYTVYFQYFQLNIDTEMCKIRTRDCEEDRSREPMCCVIKQDGGREEKCLSKWTERKMERQ